MWAFFTGTVKATFMQTADNRLAQSTHARIPTEHRMMEASHFISLGLWYDEPPRPSTVKTSKWPTFATDLVPCRLSPPRTQLHVSLFALSSPVSCTQL